MDGRRLRAFSFEGTWRDYAPIAFTNLLLTIVTLGIYRFWGTTRTRRYLWSRTRFIDDHLEWTGTGRELFIGFLLVLLLLGVPLLLLQFGVQALVLRGHGLLGGLMGLGLVLLIFYLGGVARFRALRYRLSRTYWHGIRGGSDDRGWTYGLSYMWKTVAGSLPLGLFVPWSMISLWNERWSAMSFGPHRFEARAISGGLYRRYLLFYALFILLIILFVAAITAIVVAGGAELQRGGAPSSSAVIAATFLFMFALYPALGFVTLIYYAKFFRVAIEGMSLTTLSFDFDARSKDWFKLILGDIGLVIVTLGIGSIFLSYRHWKFFVSHLNATGEIDLATLIQSTTAAPTQGEGLLDAFDIGAI